MTIKVAHVNVAKSYRGGERQTELLIRGLAGRVEQVLVARRGAPLAERERLVAELRLLQRDLAAKKRAPLPYCHSHDYATRADRLEAMRAAGIPEK